MATSSASCRAASIGSSRTGFVVGLGADATFGDVLSVDRNNDDDYDFGFHNRFHNDGCDHGRRLWPRWFRSDRRNFLVFGLVGWSWLDINTNFRIRDVDTR